MPVPSSWASWSCGNSREALPGTGSARGVQRLSLRRVRGSLARTSGGPERVAPARRRLPGREDAARLASVLRLLADPTRVRVLYALDQVDELCVGDMALTHGASQDAVSCGLRLLRMAGFGSSRKEGRVVYYRLAEGAPEPLRQHCLRRLIELCRQRAADG